MCIRVRKEGSRRSNNLALLKHSIRGGGGMFRGPGFPSGKYGLEKKSSNELDSSRITWTSKQVKCKSD